MSVTVVVCTRNRLRQLEACLDGLERQTYRGFDLLVVENGPLAGVAATCARRGIQYLHEPTAGLCFARNTAARHARGEIIAFTDDDAVADEHWLERLLQGFEHPRIGAVTGGIRYMKAFAGDPGFTGEDSHEPRRRARVVDRGTPAWFAITSLGGIGDGMNMAFRRAALLASPGFDNRLGRGRLLEGGDEHAVFMSLVAMGHAIVHVPEALVRHPFPAEAPRILAELLRQRRVSIAYLMFLWSEFPAYRSDLAKYLACSVASRVPGISGPAPHVHRLTYPQALRAAVGGVSLFARARREWREIPGPRYELLSPARSAA